MPGKKKARKKPWVPRVPTAPPTIWHKDKSDYRRKPKHKKGKHIYE